MGMARVLAVAGATAAMALGLAAPAMAAPAANHEGDFTATGVRIRIDTEMGKVLGEGNPGDGLVLYCWAYGYDTNGTNEWFKITDKRTHVSGWVIGNMVGWWPGTPLPQC